MTFDPSVTPVYQRPTPLASCATTILEAVGAALDASGIDLFPYRLIVPGQQVPVEERNVCAVVFRTMHPGRIGNQQFAGMTPGEGGWAQNVFSFSVELWAPQPMPTWGALSGYRPPPKQKMDVAALDLLDAGFVVMAALETEQFKNQLFPFKPALIGPLEPVGNLGGAAGVTLAVQLQLP